MMGEETWSPGFQDGNFSDMTLLPQSFSTARGGRGLGSGSYKNMDPYGARMSRATSHDSLDGNQELMVMSTDPSGNSPDRRMATESEMAATRARTPMVAPLASPPSSLYPHPKEDAMTQSILLRDGLATNITAPLGCWNEITDPIVKASEIQREINNRNNFFILPGKMKFTLDKAARTEWTVRSEWGEDMENKPYEFQGSKFAGDRLIRAIYLREVHNRGDVTHTLIFNLPNKSMEFNMLAPIRKVLSPSHMQGPVHVSLEPGEKMKSPLPLWAKNYDIRRSLVIQNHPDVTRETLKRSLKDCYADPKNKAVLLPTDILCEYIREQTEGTEFSGDLDWVPQSHHYEINRDIAEMHISNWVSEQCLDLTVNKIWDISVKPGTIDAEDELKRKVPLPYMGDEDSVNDYVNKIAAGVPQHISFKIQVELEPLKRMGY